MSLNCRSNLDSVLKSRHITLPTKVRILKAIYGLSSNHGQMIECWRTDASELWCWGRLLRLPWTARRSNQSILKEVNPEYSLVLKLKVHFFGPVMWRANSLEKTLMLGRREGKGTTEDEMVGWHHWLSGHEFEQAPGDGEGQGSLSCCGSWGYKELETTLWLNNNKASNLWYQEITIKFFKLER